MAPAKRIKERGGACPLGGPSFWRQKSVVVAEPQPQGVQVVEWVGLVPFSFQFFFCLAAVFADECGGLGFIEIDGQI